MIRSRSTTSCRSANAGTKACAGPPSLLGFTQSIVGDLDLRSHVHEWPGHAGTNDITRLRDDNQTRDFRSDGLEPLLGLRAFRRQRECRFRNMREPLLLERRVSLAPLSQSRIDPLGFRRIRTNSCHSLLSLAPNGCRRQQPSRLDVNPILESIDQLLGRERLAGLPGRP